MEDKAQDPAFILRAKARSEAAEVMKAFDYNQPMNSRHAMVVARVLAETLGYTVKDVQFSPARRVYSEAKAGSYYNSDDVPTRFAEIVDRYSGNNPNLPSALVNAYAQFSNAKTEGIVLPKLFSTGVRQWNEPDRADRLAPALEAIRMKARKLAWELALCNVGAVSIVDGVVWICLPLTLRTDMEGRLHSGTGPAVEWGDEEFYFYHGVRMDKKHIMHSERITATEVLSERNTEVRRCLMDLYGGFDRMVTDKVATLVKTDKHGELYTVPFNSHTRTVYGRVRQTWSPRSTYLTLVKVKNATPEPDGSVREFVLPVPNRCKTPRSAVAFTFGKRPFEYAPLQES